MLRRRKQRWFASSLFPRAIYGDGELSSVGGTYGVGVGAGVGAVSDLVVVSVFGAVSIFGAPSDFAGAFIVFDFVRGFSAEVEVVDRFDVFVFDVAVGIKCTDTGFG